MLVCVFTVLASLYPNEKSNGFLRHIAAGNGEGDSEGMYTDTNIHLQTHSQRMQGVLSEVILRAFRSQVMP